MRQHAVMDGDGLGDLQESDQFQPVESLGARLVPVKVRQACIHRRVRRDEAVDVHDPEEPMSEPGSATC